jgi:hypothetical protein
MKRISRTAVVLAAGVLFALLGATSALAQFRGFWLDIGTYQNVYSEGGARQEDAPGIPDGLDWPAILRESGHGRARGFWIGVRNWTNERGQTFPFYVGRIGPRSPGIEVTSPVDTRIIARYEDSEVQVDGALAFGRLAVVDEVDPNIAADRMIINQFNMNMGVSVTRKAYAYVNQFHDNYHLIEYEYCNTGNIDEDEEIELPNQALDDAYFFHLHRWRGSGQGAWQGSSGQAWGKFNMIDIVGDGHASYPVDFTAFYAWQGFDPSVTQYSNLGSPLITVNQWQSSADTVGRLSGASFVGRAFLHVDQSPSDETYVKCTEATLATCQPHTIGWMDQDEPLAGDNESHQNYYELGILTRENPDRFPGGSTHMFPHYADRVEPSGQFWAPTTDASSGGGSVAQGGYAPTEAVGPYDMAFGDCVYHSVVEGVAGLSYDATVQIGRTYKRGRFNESQLISYDANNDGVISGGAFDFANIGIPTYQGDGCTSCATRGSEQLTKNHWVFTARDSLFQTFFRARDAYEAGNRFTTYPIPEAPYAPVRFTVDGLPDAIELTWTPNPSGGPAIDHWEVYRTSGFTDNLLDADANGIFDTVQRPWGEEQVTGYQKVADVPAGTTAFSDRTANRGTDYYYYVVAVGQAQPNDAKAMNGTPGGVPLMSSRYLTQTYLPTNLKRPAYGSTGTVRDARIVPNPVNLGSEDGVRFAQEDRVAFFNIPPQCTIKIFTEIGELVHTIEHTNGSGDEIWNLTTSSRQLLVSGIYIAVIEDQSNGERSIQKFTVIR